jgi:hypothetical protein
VDLDINDCRWSEAFAVFGDNETFRKEFKEGNYVSAPSVNYVNVARTIVKDTGVTELSVAANVWVVNYTNQVLQLKNEGLHTSVVCVLLLLWLLCCGCCGCCCF